MESNAIEKGKRVKNAASIQARSHYASLKKIVIARNAFRFEVCLAAGSSSSNTET